MDASASQRTEQWFSSFTGIIAFAVGHPVAFAVAVLTVATWAITGSLFHYSDGWQLTMNTVSSLVTFLMVFLIQNSQNRDSAGMQIKLDELLRALENARTGMVGIEEKSQTDLYRLKQQYTELGEKVRREHDE